MEFPFDYSQVGKCLISSFTSILVKILPYAVEYYAKLQCLIHKITKSDIKFQKESFIIKRHRK